MRRRVLVPSFLASVLVLGLTTSALATQGPAVSPAAAERALENARNVFVTPLSAGGSTGSRDATAALRDLALALPVLRGADREEARSFLQRPTDKDDPREYFGKEAPDSPICDAQFCVHWTDKAENAPKSEPFLSKILDSMNLSFAVENTALGWKAAKSDGRLGGRGSEGRDGQVDVYVTNLGKNLYGYASTDPGQKGSKRYAYLVLDNDYKTFAPTPPVAAMQVTVAHEYNHILQFNYDVFQDLWLFEATATWAEEKVYPAIDDYVYYVPYLAKAPEEPMTGRTIKIYAEAVWNHWLSYSYGDDVIRETWEVSRAEKNFAVDAYDEAIRNAGGSSFSEDLGRYFVDTAEWHSSSAFPDAADYPDVKRTGTLKRATDATTELDNTSYRLYKVKPTPAADVTLEVKAERGTRSTIALVGREGGEPGVLSEETAFMPNGGKASVTLVDPGKFSRITAVVANVDGRSNRRDSKGRRVYRSDGSDFKFSLAD